MEKNKKVTKISFEGLVVRFLLACISFFAIWGIIESNNRDAGTEWIWLLLQVMLGLIPTATFIVLFTFLIKYSKTLLKNKEHQIKSSFVLMMVTILRMLIGAALLVLTILFMPTNGSGFYFWIALESIMCVQALIINLIALIKFIIAMIQEYQLVRKTIMETRILVEKQSVKK